MHRWNVLDLGKLSFPRSQTDCYLFQLGYRHEAKRGENKESHEVDRSELTFGVCSAV